MFASGTTITVAGPVAWPARARPDFPMHTLTVRATNLAGRPDTGDEVEVLNAANWPTFDITKGTNSGFASPEQACGDDYLCVAKPGYDGPTGLGTPNGTGAF